MSWRGVAIEQSEVLLARCRAAAQWLDRSYECVLELGPDPRRDARSGIIASATFHSIMVAGILIWSSHRMGGSGDSVRTISVDVVAQARATQEPIRTRVLEPAALQPAEPDLSQLKFDAALPSAEASTDSEGGTATSPDAVRAPQQSAEATSSGPDIAKTTTETSDARPAGHLAYAASASTMAAGPGHAKDFADTLRDQIAACWNSKDGDADKIILDFNLYFNTDGSISRPPELTPSYEEAAVRDPSLRSHAEALRRAIYTCAPYKLPADRYGDWQHIVAFHFDSSTLP